MSVLLLMAALTATDPTSAASPEPPAIVGPTWVATPTAEEAQAVYPKAAADKRLEGRATLKCSVTAEGRLTGCTSVAEEPAGQGFAAAALAIAPKFQMQTVTKDGTPVAGGTVRVPIRFANPTQMPPGFRRMPSSDDLAKVYPEKALRRRVAGEAVIECAITVQGEMADCALASESPMNYGFGLAALRLAPLFNVEPKMKNGVPVKGAAVTIPVRFGPPS